MVTASGKKFPYPNPCHVLKTLFFNPFGMGNGTNYSALSFFYCAIIKKSDKFSMNFQL